MRTENDVDPYTILCHAKDCNRAATRVCERGSCEFAFCSQLCVDMAKRGNHAPHWWGVASGYPRGTAGDPVFTITRTIEAWQKEEEEEDRGRSQSGKYRLGSS